MDIGSRSGLAFSIGDKSSPDMKIVDIWVGSVLVTYFDNSVYLPTFIGSLKRELEDIENGVIDKDYVFFDHGPTTDDVIARGRLDEGNISIDCNLDNGEVISIELPVELITDTYRKCIKVLDVVAT